MIWQQKGGPSLGTVISIVLGAVFTLVITGIVEAQKRPQLKLQKIDPRRMLIDDPMSQSSAEALIVNVRVINAPLPKWIRWMLVRNVATHCRAEITFQSLDGRNIFGERKMDGRWADSPQPSAATFKLGSEVIPIRDLSRKKVFQHMDIHSDAEGTILDIAAKFSGEYECYGWSNDSYFSTYFGDPFGHPRQWKLPANQYLVTVSVFYAGQSEAVTFKLANDNDHDQFRLLEVSG